MNSRKQLNTAIQKSVMERADEDFKRRCWRRHRRPTLDLYGTSIQQVRQYLPRFLFDTSGYTVEIITGRDKHNFQHHSQLTDEVVRILTNDGLSFTAINNGEALATNNYYRWKPKPGVFEEEIFFKEAKQNDIAVIKVAGEGKIPVQGTTDVGQEQKKKQKKKPGSFEGGVNFGDPKQNYTALT